MSSLLVFLVAYAGIGGKDASAIDRQVGAALDDHGEITKVKVTRNQRLALVERDGAAAILDRLDVDGELDGVIAGTVERTRKGATVRVVVLGADGALVELIEIPLARRKTKRLAKADLAALEETLVAAVDRLTAPPPPPPVADPEPVPELDTPTVAEVAEVAPRPRRREALGWIAAGAGIRTRTFAPGPAMVDAYRASPVPAAQLAAEVRPLRFVALGGELDRTLTMSSDVDGAAVPTSILGWQATAALRVRIGAVELAAFGGAGARHFEIDGPAPTPDGHYVHAIVGGRATAHLGARVAVRAFAAVLPVIGGEEATPAPTARSGLEVGGAVELTAAAPVFVLVEGGYQRFSWSWQDGTSVDEFPSGTLSIGARY